MHREVLCVHRARCIHYRVEECPPFGAGCDVSVSQAVVLLLEAKKLANRRPKTITSMGIQLRHFANWLGLRGHDLVRDLTPELVEGYMRGSKTPVDANNRLRRVSVLCSFAVRRQWLPSNPCSRVDAPTIERKHPMVWTVDECKLALSTVHACHRTMMVLGLLCGLRPAEVERLDWQNIHLDGDHPQVVVDAAASKVRARRLVPIQPNAVAWLRLDARGAGPICGPQSSTRMRENARQNGIVWPPDVLRHTYASMRFASGVGAAELSQEMGHSESVLFRHYRQVVDAKDADRFWEILPEGIDNT